MQALIDTIVEKTGIDPALAQKAVSMVLSLVQSEGDDGLVSQLFSKMPGAGDLARQGTDALSSGAGGGGLMGMVGNVLGGSTGNIMSAVSALQADGLDMGQIKQIGGEVLGYAKEQGGDDLVSQVTSSIPGLDKLL